MLSNQLIKLLLKWSKNCVKEIQKEKNSSP